MKDSHYLSLTKRDSFNALLLSIELLTNDITNIFLSLRFKSESFMGFWGFGEIGRAHV